MRYIKEVGILVRAHRDQRGWTQEKLGLEIGKTERTISQIENGAVATSLDTFFRISKALDVPLWNLFKIPALIDEADEERFEKIAAMLAKVSAMSPMQTALVEALVDTIDEFPGDYETASK